MDDTPRQVATSRDDYTLTIEEAALRYEHAGHPRTTRSIQRYCSHGDLDCLRQETQFGEKYLTTEASVARHIAQIEEVTRATSRDVSRQVASRPAPTFNEIESRQVTTEYDMTPPPVAAVAAPTHTAATVPLATASDDVSRQVATSPSVDSKYVERRESEVTFLREQIGTKDSQIKELTERSRETNVLIGGLQRMLSPLLGSPDNRHDPYDNEHRPN